MSTIIKANSYCPVCRGIVLADCRHNASEFSTRHREIPPPSPAHKEVVEALQGCISYRNWQIAVGGPVPEELKDVWKQAETILSRLKTMNEGERP